MPLPLLDLAFSNKMGIESALGELADATLAPTTLLPSTDCQVGPPHAPGYLDIDDFGQTLLYSRRGTDPSHPNSAGMALGVSIGLAVAVLIDLWCPVAYLPHLLVGHLLPIVILALLGFAIGRKLLRA